uniref:SH2 domain-containing protein n=1 Tax=Globodera rostochiensis TaxID=31243 RepID=A0A914HWF1_GLORO
MAAESSTSAEAEEEAMWQLPYYHGDLDREETEQLLTRDGDFLVRKGEDMAGQVLLFVLSVMVFGHVRHVIFRQRRGLIAVDFSRERGFATISGFVDAHLEKKDSISSRELVMLRRAIGRPKVQQNVDLNVCNDVWLDTLKWIRRAEVGTKFALINARFNSVVNLHLKERKWSMGELHIRRATAGTGAEIHVPKDDDNNNKDDGTKFEVLAIATSPLPAYIIGINSLNIWYIDQEVLTFLHRMRRLFRSDIALEFSILPTAHRSWSIMARQIWPLIGHGIDTLVNMKKRDFALLLKHISPTVIFDCVNLRRVYTDMYPQCSTDDGEIDVIPPARRGNHRHPERVGRGRQMPGANDLYEWLHVLRPDGRPKVLIFPKWKRPWARLRRNLKKNFAEASTAARFIIYTPVPRRFQQRFNEHNALTQERLALASRMGSALYKNYRSTSALMLRCPMDFDGQNVVDWEVEANELFKSHISIGFGDEDIGPLSTTAGPSK